MINKKKKYVGRVTLAAAITSILFSGCGAAQKELAQTDRVSYEKISYHTVTVQSGSLTPQTTIITVSYTHMTLPKTSRV